jgi:ferrochelatase
LEAKAQQGLKSVDVCCPGFVSDCLETLEEIQMEVREAFEHAGGERFQYIPCLNDSPAWIDGMASLTEQHLQGWPTHNPVDAAALATSREQALALGAKD